MSHAAQHLIVAVFYATGLVGVAAVRSRHRFDYLEEAYSLVEALLWRGIYLSKLPGLQRKLQVFLEWTLEVVFPRDISLLDVKMTEVVGPRPSGERRSGLRHGRSRLFVLRHRKGSGGARG